MRRSGCKVVRIRQWPIDSSILAQFPVQGSTLSTQHCGSAASLLTPVPDLLGAPLREVSARISSFMLPREEGRSNVAFTRLPTNRVTALARYATHAAGLTAGFGAQRPISYLLTPRRLSVRPSSHWLDMAFIILAN